MTLKVGTTPHSQWQALTPLLVSFGWHNPQSDKPETWYQNAPVSSESTHLLLHSRPETAVAQAIEAGQTPSEALQAWRTAAQHMLAFYKRNRATSVMVDVCSAVREPQACVDALKEHLALSAVGSVPALSCPEQSASVNQLLANQLIVQSEELSNLLAEVEACTIPLDHQTFRSPRFHIEELYKKLQEESSEQAQLNNDLENERLSHAETKKALDETREENDLILQQLFQVQEELERYYLAGKEKDSELENKDSELQTKNTESRDKNNQLQTMSMTKQALVVKNTQLQARIQSLESALEQVNGSFSWKLTAPIRLLARFVTSPKKATLKKGHLAVPK